MPDLTYDVLARDRGATSTFSKVAKAMDDTSAAAKRSTRAGLDLNAANLRTEKATKAVSAATAKYGKDSLEARTASHALAKAQYDAETAVTKLSKATDSGAKVSVRAGTSFGKIRESIGGVVPVAAAGGVAVAGFGLKAITAASDLNETVSKAGVIFGASTQRVLDFGDTAAKTMGQSKQQAIDAASAFGALFEGMGIGVGQATNLSLSMTKLASDIASFSNADPAYVIDALTGAFRGEYDELQRFVPTISAAAVQTEALAETHKRTAAQLTDGEKALATYQLIMKGTTQAQGDFARTANGAANQQRTLSAESKDAAAHIGQQLLPAYKQALTAGQQLVIGTDKLVGSIAGLPTEAKAAGVGILGLGLVAKNWTSIASTAETGVLKFRYALDKITPGTVAAGAGLGVLSVAVGALIKRQEDAKQESKEFIDTMLQSSGITDAAGQIDFLRKALGNEAVVQKLSNQNKLDAIMQIRGLNEQLKAQTAASQVTTKQNDLMSQSYEDVTDAADKQKTAVQQLADELDKGLNPRLDLVKANLSFKESLVGLTAAHHDNGASLSENTEKGRANRKALLDAIDAAKGAAEAESKLGGSLEHNEGVLKTNIAAVREAAKAAGLNKVQVDALVASIYKMPPSKTARILADIASAQRSVGRIQAQISQVKGKRVTIQVAQDGGLQRVVRDLDALSGRTVSVTVFTKFGKVGENAAGTRNWPGGWSLVGEQGPELVHLPRGTDVYNASETRALTRARTSAPAAESAGGGVMAAQPIVIQMDGVKVWQGLLRVRRLANGGLALGLG